MIECLLGLMEALLWTPEVFGRWSLEQMLFKGFKLFWLEAVLNTFISWRHLLRCLIKKKKKKERLQLLVKLWMCWHFIVPLFHGRLNQNCLQMGKGEVFKCWDLQKPIKVYHQKKGGVRKKGDTALLCFQNYFKSSTWWIYWGIV